MHTKTPSKSATSARSPGKKNAPAPASVPVSASTRATRHRPQSEKSPVAPASGTGGTPAVPAPAERGIRTSISLYESDLDCLEPLRVLLRTETGVRSVPDSAMVQTLCRVCKPGPEHVAAFRAVLASTGRTYRRRG